MTSVYWRDGLPSTRPVSADPPPGKLDVAVVGAGFAGLSVALDLLAAAPGLRIAVIEARHAGYGASGRNAGGVLPLAVLPWLLPGSADGHDRAMLQRQLHTRVDERMRQLSHEHPAGQPYPVKLVLIASNRLITAGLGWAEDALAAAGITVARWSADEVTAACDAPAASGLALPAWTIHPAAMVDSLAAEFIAIGGLLHEHVPVSAAVPTSRTVELILANGGRVHADRVVICTGAYTNSLLLPDPPYARVVHSYMRASRAPLGADSAPAELGGDRLFLSAPGPAMAYWRTHAGHLLFGGVDMGGLPPGETADALPRAHRKVDRLLRRLLPAAADHRPGHRWGGPIHVTPTEVPHLARSTACERIVYALGFSGSGVALTLSAGPLVRDLVLGSAHADDEAVVLRDAMNATRIPWRGLVTAAGSTTAHLLRGLVPYR